MYSIQEGTLLWEPTKGDIDQSNIQSFLRFLQRKKSLNIKNDHELWKWSVTEIEDFWESLWDYFQIKSISPYTTVLSERKMPGAKWFPGAKVNYTEHIFRNKTKKRPAIIHAAETRETSEISWDQLYQETAAFQKTLQDLGVGKGDRVVA